jgi:hypothetical protein
MYGTEAAAEGRAERVIVARQLAETQDRIRRLLDAQQAESEVTGC